MKDIQYNERKRNADLMATCKDILMAPYFFGQCRQVNQCQTPGCQHVAEPHGLCLVCEEERQQNAQDETGVAYNNQQKKETDDDNQTNNH